jgi:hypothetical protein
VVSAEVEEIVVTAKMVVEGEFEPEVEGEAVVESVDSEVGESIGAEDEEDIVDWEVANH